MYDKEMKKNKFRISPSTTKNSPIASNRLSSRKQSMQLLNPTKTGENNQPHLIDESKYSHFKDAYRAMSRKLIK